MDEQTENEVPPWLPYSVRYL